ncbi:hypothetical protein C4577_00375 [Candidatus Parcubacteria bacterium]|nr:MAG: hypothetical protein C4577_00375 [Candidatus Parcubacteria bacterium]
MFLSVIANRIVVTLLIVMVATPTIIYGGIKANDYRQTQIILQEAKQLSSEGKYQEAINKLNTTENKWSTSGTIEEVRLAIEDNKQLIGSSKNYELGKEIFDKGNYKDALELFKKVDIRNINYPSALSLIGLAEKKSTDTLKGEVAGVITIKNPTPIQNKNTALLSVQPTPNNQLPSPTPQPIVIQPAGYSNTSPQSQTSVPQPTYKQITGADYTQNFTAVIYGFDLANKCYQQAISQITTGDRTGFNVTLDQCRSIVSPLQSIIHQNVSTEVKRVEFNLGSAWGQYNYLFSQMGSLSVSVDFPSSFQDDLKVNEGRYQKAVNYANEAIKEWQAISQ